MSSVYQEPRANENTFKDLGAHVIDGFKVIALTQVISILFPTLSTGNRRTAAKQIQNYVYFQKPEVRILERVFELEDMTKIGTIAEVNIPIMHKHCYVGGAISALRYVRAFFEGDLARLLYQLTEEQGMRALKDLKARCIELDVLHVNLVDEFDTVKMKNYRACSAATKQRDQLQQNGEQRKDRLKRAVTKRAVTKRAKGALMKIGRRAHDKAKKGLPPKEAREHSDGCRGGGTERALLSIDVF